MTSWLAFPLQVARRLRRRVTSRQLSAHLSWFLLLTLLVALLPPPPASAHAPSIPPVSAAAMPSTAPETPSAAIAPTGTLRFPPAVDTDQDAATNPLAAAPLPVLRIGGDGQEVRYAVLPAARLPRFVRRGAIMVE